MWGILLILSTIAKAKPIEIPDLNKKPDCSPSSVLKEVGAHIKDFIEVFPSDSSQPEVATEVFVGKFSGNLYFLFVCHEKGKVQYRLLKRDEFRMDNDWVAVVIDPDNSGTRFYSFGMNPAGSIFDYLQSSGTANFSYDFPWRGEAVLFDSTWLALFEIPLSLFSNVKEDNFKIQFLRFRPSSAFYQYVWPPVPASSNDDPFGVFSLFNTKTTIFGFNFIPYWTLTSGSPVSLGNVQVRSGLTGKLSHASGINLLFALNPDFSTVESDAPQITINSPYALFLSEKRPVFLENGDIFERKSYMIYTRRIKEPLWVLKLGGKVRNTELGLITSYDLSNSLLYAMNLGSFEIPLSDSALENIFTVRQYMGKGTFAGLVFNTRNSTTSRANYAGFFESGLNYRDFIYFNGVYGYSVAGVEELDKKGSLFDASLSMKLRGFAPFVSVFIVSKDFNNQNGFLKVTDRKQYTSGFSWKFPARWALFNFGQMDFSYSIISDYDRRFKNDSLSFTLLSSLKYRSNISFMHVRYSKDVFGMRFDNLNLTGALLSLNPLDLAKIQVFYGVGKTINYYVFERSDFKSFAVTLDLYMKKNALTSLEFRRYVLGEFGDQSTLYFKLNYNFTRQFSLRWLTSYDGEYFEFSPLLTYQLSPYTLFYAGSTIKGWKKDRFNEWEKKLIVKAQMSLDIPRFTN